MKDKIISIAKENNGYITNKILKENNIPSVYIYRLVNERIFKKLYHGIFIMDGYIEDEFYIIHLLYPNLIFCMETALYLQGLSNRQFSGYYGAIHYNAYIQSLMN